MNKLLHAVTALVVLVGAAQAQFTLRTLTQGGNLGNRGGAVFFDLTVRGTVTIDRIDFRVGTALASSATLSVYLGPSTYVGNQVDRSAWIRVATVTTSIGTQRMASGPLDVPLALGRGDYGVALVADGNFSHSYTNGTGCSSNTTPGSCANSLFLNRHMTVSAGAAQNIFSSSAPFTPRVWNGALHYRVGGDPIRVASSERYGPGCYARNQSYYQLFPNPSGLNLGVQDPANPTSIRHTLTSTGYEVTVGTRTIRAPASAPLTLGNNPEDFSAASVLPGRRLPFPVRHPVPGGTTLANDLQICTAGYISPALSTQAPDTSPSIREFLDGAARWAPLWRDLDLSPASSRLYVEFDGPDGTLNVTWVRAQTSGSTAESSFQVAFFPNGDVEYRYGGLSRSGGGADPVLIGWSTGNRALDPGSVEIVTRAPFRLDLSDSAPLALAAVDRPLIGRRIELETTGIPQSGATGALLLGFVSRRVELGLVGAPGCFLNLESLDALTVPMAPPSARVPLVIPADSSLNGRRLFVQSVSLAGGLNPAGFVTSNGLQLNLGSL